MSEMISSPVTISCRMIEQEINFIARGVCNVGRRDGGSYLVDDHVGGGVKATGSTMNMTGE